MSKGNRKIMRSIFTIICLLCFLSSNGCDRQKSKSVVPTSPPSPAVTPVVGTLQLYFEDSDNNSIRATANASTVIAVFTAAGVPTVQSSSYLTNPINPRQINIFKSIELGKTPYDGGTFASQGGTKWAEAFVYQSHIEDNFWGTTAVVLQLTEAQVDKVCCYGALHECGHAFGFRDLEDDSNKGNIMYENLAPTVDALRNSTTLPTFSAEQIKK